jgi:hypothetical protein
MIKKEEIEKDKTIKRTTICSNNFGKNEYW